MCERGPAARALLGLRLRRDDDRGGKRRRSASRRSATPADAEGAIETVTRRPSACSLVGQSENDTYEVEDH
jgi:hypothetical protein